ncbi:hypothetical protein GLOIN_2v1591804 [Rhizophagus irregularis DAOM 181602=DAOM 197198]|nr:hypothetical protein GLOIN_2v1591804 [Rhizophagus irregularis DAOM 181602=DAOM 197198]
MFMNEISTLKSLDYDTGYSKKVQSVMFTYLPEAKNCLKDLSELRCSSDIYSDFFYQLSQICHNIRTLTIEFGDIISNGLTDLISLQNNLKSVTLIYYSYESENEEEIGTLKLILNNCQYLETINIWCGDGYLNEKEILEIFAKHSPKNFYELEIFYAYKARSKISFEDLEKFFINWKNRLSQKPLSLIVIKSYDCISLELKVENMKIIERYIKMGVIKKFKTKKFEED